MSIKLKLRLALTNITATVAAVALAVTGFRFDKSYRHAETGYKALVYSMVSTPMANIKADHLKNFFR